MDVTAKLKQRVEAGLSNPEFTEPEYDPIYTAAIEEMAGIVGNRDLAEAFRMDIAYYRFLLLVDAGVSETDEHNYKLALSALKNAGYLSTDETDAETTVSSRVRVKQRKSDY